MQSIINAEIGPCDYFYAKNALIPDLIHLEYQTPAYREHTDPMAPFTKIVPAFNKTGTNKVYIQIYVFR